MTIGRVRGAKEPSNEATPSLRSENSLSMVWPRSSCEAFLLTYSPNEDRNRFAI